MTLGILPRLQDLEDWVQDLEQRVPGPPPEQPRRQPPPEDRRRPEVSEPPPPTEDYPAVGYPTDPTIIERIDKLEDCCDPAAEAERHKQLERDLECREIPACELGIQIAGILAECWARTHTPTPLGVAGVFTGWNNASPIISRVIAASPERTFPSVQNGQQQSTQQQSAQQYGLYDGYASAIDTGSSIALAWGNGESVSASLPGTELIRPRSWIFASPEEQQAAGIQYRTVALRDDEIDPCTPTLEIP